MTSSRHQFYSIPVKKIVKNTPECSVVMLDVSPEQKELFQYLPGQYITFKINLNGEEFRRSYSICSIPSDPDISVAVKQVEDGTVSTYMNETLREGDVLEVMPPMGNFTTQISPDRKKHYVAFAAGSGITPVISLLRFALKEERESRFTLIYGNQNSKSIIFLDVLNELISQYEDRLQVVHVLSRENDLPGSISGRIDASKLPDLLNNKELLDADHYFLCGPQGMIEEVTQFLKSHEVNPEKIQFELFTTDSELETQEEVVLASDAADSKVTILLDEEATELSIKKEGRVILDAAIEAGIDPPYSCRGAVCTTCMARLQEGQVRMEMNYALTDQEIQDGFILTCQSHPVTDEVKISYDDV